MRNARKCRVVMYPPHRLTFKPAGVSGNMLKEIALTVDEYEAIRLADYEELEHEEAAAKMNISRPTFTRLIKKARHNVAIFLIECRRLEINGGNFHFKSDLVRCQDCGAYFYQDIHNRTTKCRECGSENIISLAEELGHGDCCRENNE
ncbi:MAG: DUF134 domain-containing protein [Candidatus Cloacimonetes bacterium]|nr:DUF134 domain-containing protein [Candidatus Cloacimonadota bacterium]